MTGFVKVERIGGGRVGADARVGNGEAGIDDGVPFWNAEKRPEINACHSSKILTFRILRLLEIEDSNTETIITHRISRSMLSNFDFVDLYFSFL